MSRFYFFIMFYYEQSYINKKILIKSMQSMKKILVGEII